MAKFENGFEITHKNEYGIEHDPKDPGGATADGIDRKNNQNWEGWPIYDRYKNMGYSGLMLENALRKDAHFMSLVVEYYHAIWHKLRLDEVADQSVANNIFDAYINPGPLAIKIVQRWVGVADDGMVGSKTIAAINSANASSLIFALYTWKKGYYEARPEKLKAAFLKGWMNRAERMRNA